MNPTSVAWRGLTIGAGSVYRIRALDGWEELPAHRYEKNPRTRAHGTHASDVWADERIITLEGWCWTAAERDQAVADLQDTMTFGGGEEPLTVTAAGRTLTAQAQLLAARQQLLRGEWGVGRFGWLAQWRCPDPLRYGAAVTAPTGLPSPGGGLLYNLYKPGKLDYGTPGGSGRLTLSNAGNAPAPIVFDVLGPLPAGFEISAAGQRLVYPTAVPAGQTITIDTAGGTVLAEGTADRRAELTVADWIQVPPRSDLTVQFTSLGGYEPAASLTASWSETRW